MMENQNNYDVLIVGGAIAGASAALYLKKLGIENVCILEKETFPKLKLCTGLFTKSTYELMLEIGIDAVNEIDYCNIHQDEGPSVYYKNKKRLQLNSKKPFYCPETGVREDFDTYVYKKIIDNNIELKENKKIKDIKFDDNILQTESEVYRYKYLIFADGVNGASAKYTNIKKRSICLQAEIKRESSDRLYYNVHFDKHKKGYGWVAATKEYSIIGFSDEFKITKDYRKMLIDFAKEQGYSICEKDIRSAHVPTKVSKTITINNNVMLIGDAAGFPNPLTMGGIYQAVYSAKAAANAVKNKNIKIYKRQIRSLVSNQRIFSFLTNVFFLRPVQFLFWNIFVKLFRKVILLFFEKIIMKRKTH